SAILRASGHPLRESASRYRNGNGRIGAFKADRDITSPRFTVVDVERKLPYPTICFTQASRNIATWFARSAPRSWILKLPLSLIHNFEHRFSVTCSPGRFFRIESPFNRPRLCTSLVKDTVRQCRAAGPSTCFQVSSFR